MLYVKGVCCVVWLMLKKGGFLEGIKKGVLQVRNFLFSMCWLNFSGCGCVFGCDCCYGVYGGYVGYCCGSGCVDDYVVYYGSGGVCCVDCDSVVCICGCISCF